MSKAAAPRCVVAIFASLIIASGSIAGAQPLEQALDDVMRAKGMGPPGTPGCAVNVMRKGEVLLDKAYGFADLEHSVAFTRSTVGETGSVAKQFVSAALLVLVEQGKVALADDIRKVLPEMPDYGRPVRIHDLLHQTSGLREWGILGALRGYPRYFRKVYGMPDLFGLLTSQRALNFEPGERYEYSNSNAALMALIVERVSGQSLQQFSKEQLFEPLGMNSTIWRDDLRAVVPQRATAYRKTAGDRFEQFMPFEEIIGPEGLLTTVGDLQRWNAALMQGRPSAFVVSEMLKPGQLRSAATRPYGGGLFIAPYRGHRAFRHGGNSAGYGAQLWALPEQGISIAALCNANIGEMNLIASRLVDVLLDVPTEAPAATALVRVDPPPAALAPAWFRTSGGEMLAFVQSHSGQRWIDLYTGEGYLPLAATRQAGRFTSRNNFASLEFSFIGANRIELAPSDRETLIFERMQASQRAGFEITGRYESADMKTAFRVERNGSVYRLASIDREVDYPLRFELRWLNGTTYLAHLEPDSTGFRNDLMATFEPPRGAAPAVLRLSAVMGLQAIDNLEFRRVTR